MDNKQNCFSGTAANPRICFFSQQNLYKEVSRCPEYEFEDVICEVEDVELLRPEPYCSFTIGQKVANQLARHISIASLNIGIRKLSLKGEYDVFFAMCQSPRDLLSVNCIKGWRDRCQTSICWLEEIWATDLNNWVGHLKLLSKFDWVFLSSSMSVQPVQDIIKRPCFYLPPGVDAIKFCPYPNPSPRPIDVYYMGRKSPVMHRALLEMAEQRKMFYIYDTFENMKTSLNRDHRTLLANMIKRSRYFFVNAGKIGTKFEINGQSEIGYRFFEGASAGAVLIGEPPKNKVFKQYFDWPDVVIQVPFDSPDIVKVLTDLDSQPERLEKIRRNNVIQSLLRHDWVYRWRAILEKVGLEPRPALVTREKHLKKLAKDIEKNS